VVLWGLASGLTGGVECGTAGGGARRTRVVQEYAVGLFDRFKKPASETKDAGTAGAAGADPKAGKVSAAEGVLEFDPGKARAWFDRAAPMHEAGNYEYAMTCWLSGLRFSPDDMKALEGFFSSAAGHLASAGPKAGVPKEVAKTITGRTPIDRYLEAVLAWACKPGDVDLGLRALLATQETTLREPMKFISPKVLDLAQREAKPKKDTFVKLMKVFVKIEDYKKAALAADLAYKLDPSDNALAADARNLAAQATMSSGGYDKVKESGGFRANLKNAEAQRQLVEQDQVVKSAEVAARTLEGLKAKYAATPLDRPTIKQYVAELIRRGTPEDEQEAISVLDKAHADMQDFAFRKASGELKLKIGRRELRQVAEQLRQNPGDAELAGRFRAAEVAQLNLEIAEYEANVAAYPTDLGLKYELGLRYAAAGKHNEAIEQFQLAKSEAKNKANTLHRLGRSFSAIGWQEEAIATFREALEGMNEAEALSLELRYDLLSSLEQRARAERELGAAEEALALASKIALQQMTYKDIRQRRDALKALVTELKAS